LQSLLAASQSEPAKQQSLVFVDNRESQQALPELERRWGAECSLSFCMDDFPERRAATGPQITWEMAMADTKWTRILVPVCSGQQLAHIALGLSTDKLTSLVGWSIRQGMAVVIDRVDYGFTERTPEAYRVMLNGYVRQVAAYGVIVGAPALKLTSNQPEADRLSLPEIPWSLAEPVKNKLTKADEASRQCVAVSFDKRLFSEREAMSLTPLTVLNIAKSTVLTPSAIDVLKKLKVEVYRGEVKYL